jgi:primosomal protein N' (replication factor Y)
VTLVGVVSADSGLFVPDYRAAERSFRVLYQVAGRAGRAHKEGVVVFQTHCPENYAVQTAARCDYEGFVQQELQFRKSAGYPPFTRLIRILVEGSRLPRVHDVARDIRTDLEGIADLEALGPAPAVIAIVKNRHRLHCLAKCRTDASFRVAMERLNGVHGRGSSSLRIMVDVDPASLL